MTKETKDKQPAPPEPQPVPETERTADEAADDAAAKTKTKEIGGPKGPEPTRFGDWERGGICVDF